MIASFHYLLASVVILLTGLGCDTPSHPQRPLRLRDPEYGYRWGNLAPPEKGNSDSLLVIAAFSGGGTRASTLAFGALLELARQQITWEGKQKRLLDELDVIYALSGGTFTGAYYALFGDQSSTTSIPFPAERFGERAQVADPPIAQQLVPALVTLFRPCPYHGRAFG